MCVIIVLYWIEVFGVNHMIEDLFGVYITTAYILNIPDRCCSCKGWEASEGGLSAGGGSHEHGTKD